MRNNNLGFTLIELVVVMAIAATLFGLIMFNLLGVQKSSEVTATADSLISDMAGQQTKAMLGSSASGASGTNYGIHFESDSYILFEGNTYNALDPKNFTVTISSGVYFSNVLFPSGNLIFTYATGTISGYLNGSNYVTVEDLDGIKSKTITVNRYGVVTD